MFWVLKIVGPILKNLESCPEGVDSQVKVLKDKEAQPFLTALHSALNGHCHGHCICVLDIHGL